MMKIARNRKNAGSEYGDHDHHDIQERDLLPYLDEPLHDEVEPAAQVAHENSQERPRHEGHQNEREREEYGDPEAIQEAGQDVPSDPSVPRKWRSAAEGG